MSQDFSVLLHTPTDGTDGDCTASLKNPRGIEPRRILPQPRGSQAHTCMSPQSSDCLTFIHNLKPSDPSIFFRTPHFTGPNCWGNRSGIYVDKDCLEELIATGEATKYNTIERCNVQINWKLK